MRLCSDDKSDPGYDAFQLLRAEGREVKSITMDGKPIDPQLCTMIDDDKGEVRVARLDAEGGVLVAADRIVQQTLTGEVVFTVGARR